MPRMQGVSGSNPDGIWQFFRFHLTSLTFKINLLLHNTNPSLCMQFTSYKHHCVKTHQGHCALEFDLSSFPCNLCKHNNILAVMACVQISSPIPPPPPPLCTQAAPHVHSSSQHHPINLKRQRLITTPLTVFFPLPIY